MSAPSGLSPEELDAQSAAALPDREAMSTLDPASALDGTALLDLDVNIDAAVSANLLSPDSDSVAVASQTSVINQQLDGVAIADPDQTSDIDQGEVAPVAADTPATTEGA